MESTTMTKISRSRSLSMSNPRLPLVVSQAAIEFDDAANGDAVEATLSEIERLEGSEFPYLHSREGLKELR